MPQRVQVGGRAERHHRALVRCSRVDRDRRVPEHAQHRHALAVVPGARSHRSARPRDPPHLGDTRRGVAHEVDDELAERGVERAVRERERLGAADADVGSRHGGRARLDERPGGIDGRDRARPEPGGELRRQRTGAAADVDRAVTVGDADRSHEDGRQRAGPETHVPLVGVGRCAEGRRSVGHRCRLAVVRRPVKTSA